MCPTIPLVPLSAQAPCPQNPHFSPVGRHQAYLWVELGLPQGRPWGVEKEQSLEQSHDRRWPQTARQYPIPSGLSDPDLPEVEAGVRAVSDPRERGKGCAIWGMPGWPSLPCAGVGIHERFLGAWHRTHLYGLLLVSSSQDPACSCGCRGVPVCCGPSGCRAQGPARMLCCWGGGGSRRRSGSWGERGLRKPMRARFVSQLPIWKRGLGESEWLL